MSHSINARPSATLVSLLDDSHLDARDRGKYVERRRLDPLSVQQVAGVVVGDTARHLRAPTGPGHRQQFGYVPYSLAECPCERRVHSVLLEQRTVLLHRRTAAGRIHRHAINPSGLESIDVATSEPPRTFEVTPVRVQGSAAILAQGVTDHVPIRG